MALFAGVAVFTVESIRKNGCVVFYFLGRAGGVRAQASLLQGRHRDVLFEGNTQLERVHRSARCAIRSFRHEIYCEVACEG